MFSVCFSLRPDKGKKSLNQLMPQLWSYEEKKSYDRVSKVLICKMYVGWKHLHGDSQTEWVGAFKSNEGPF